MLESQGFAACSCQGGALYLRSATRPEINMKPEKGPSSGLFLGFTLVWVSVLLGFMCTTCVASYKFQVQVQGGLKQRGSELLREVEKARTLSVFSTLRVASYRIRFVWGFIRFYQDCSAANGPLGR